MRRRDFLIQSSRAFVPCLIVNGARAQSNPAADRTTVDARWRTLIADLEVRIPALMKDAVVPGLSIALVYDGKLLWRKAYGVKDSVSKEPVDDDTVFEAASVSKTVFAYAIMKLHEKNVIDLDTPLTRYA